jgi:prepilin-type N-terminal cleavage/methylation domain-containing protein
VSIRQSDAGQATGGKTGDAPRVTRDAARAPRSIHRHCRKRAIRPRSKSSIAFTLIELLVVISIMGVLAALAIPAIKNFGKAEAAQAAVRQMLDDVGRARQLALSQRTTVYMVFLPAEFWKLPGYGALPPAEKEKAAKLYDKQLSSYAFVTLRSVGDQPGRHAPRYLGPWRSLPEGTFIAAWKFTPRGPVLARYPNPSAPIFPFHVTGFGTDSVPFPSAEAPTGVLLPCLAFDHLGQLTSKEDEFIPLARGSVGYATDANKVPIEAAPSVQEKPPGNSTDTNSFNLIHIEWLTGRAKLHRQEVK